MNLQRLRNFRNYLNSLIRQQRKHTLPGITKRGEKEMESLKILKSKHIDLNKPVLLIDREDALGNLIEAINKFCPNLDIESMSKKDLEVLLDSFGNAVINYHPEDYHQERAVLLENSQMLEKYGLTEEEINALDFT